MTVSVIIVAKTYTKNLEECVKACRNLNLSDFEVLIIPDSLPKEELFLTGDIFGKLQVKVIPTGPVSPARKRDMAMNYAAGEILAFIDDDAYPAKDWLKNALEHFKDKDVAAVVGPAITPPHDNFRQRASGRVYSSLLVSGTYTYRYKPKNKLEVDDYPSCNFLLRKSIMEELGGFNTDFWPGEDTKLCLDITKGLGKKIIYDPAVLVYHHRRPLFLAHLKQIANYALHRGYFAKRYPQTSLRLLYFLPSIFLFLLLIGAFSSLFLLHLRVVYLAGIFLYLFSVFIFSICKELRLIPLVFLGIILSHLTYGLNFIKGLISQKLKEEL
jgi:GT2 family glycosyltransferase